jgi:hypothetical protein
MFNPIGVAAVRAAFISQIAYIFLKVLMHFLGDP